MKIYMSGGPLLIALQLLGCTGEVSETEDSTKIEVEIPKLETGQESPDLDPATDDDVDIDTPRPGDT